MASPGLDPRTDAFWHGRESVVFANPRDSAAVEAARSALECGGIEDGTTGGSNDSAGLVCFLTSGSSGRPKIVGFRREALLSSARSVNTFLGLTKGDVWLRILPRFHVGGFQVEARAWSVGALCVSADDPWDVDSFAANCVAERVTAVSLVPTQVFDLVRARISAPACLRVVLVGAGALRPMLFAAARALGWPVRASYGLTEAASTVAVQADGEPDSGRLTVLPHWQAAAGSDGRLELCGPALPAAVAAWDEATSRYEWRPLEPPLRTSDRVLLEGGTLVFLGRADRVVKRLGELIDLDHLERRFEDAALAAGVFGRVRLRSVADRRAGSRLVVECLDAAEGAAVAARFNDGQPAFARIDDTLVVVGLRLSPLGKPLA